jgi:hypothetical protein
VARKRTLFLITTSITSQYCVVTKTYFIIFSHYWIITEVFFITFSLPWSVRYIFITCSHDRLVSKDPSILQSPAFLNHVFALCCVAPDSVVSPNRCFTSYSLPTARSIYGCPKPWRWQLNCLLKHWDTFNILCSTFPKRRSHMSYSSCKNLRTRITVLSIQYII